MNEDSLKGESRDTRPCHYCKACVHFERCVSEYGYVYCRFTLSCEPLNGSCYIFDTYGQPIDYFACFAPSAALEP